MSDAGNGDGHGDGDGNTALGCLLDIFIFMPLRVVWWCGRGLFKMVSFVMDIFG